MPYSKLQKATMSKERPQPPVRLTFEEVTCQAHEITLKQGRHVTMVIAEGSEQTVIARIQELDSTFEGRRQQMFELGFALARKDLLGLLDQVFLICEAWMSLATDKTTAIPPSKDPKRKEVLMVSHLDTRRATTQVAIFEMIRATNGKLTRLLELDREGMQVDSPLLMAFVQGYALGLLGGLPH